MATFVIIDDDPGIVHLICEAVGSEEHACRSAQTLSKGLELARAESPDIVFLDLSMPDGNGLDWLHVFLEIPSAPEVIVITASDSEKSVETAIYQGAWDFVQKPFSVNSLTHLVRQALRYRRDKAGGKQFVALKRPGIIGESQALYRALQQVAHAASSTAPCLIHGETGVGKELIARTIHANSDRCNGPFVVVDCAALSETLTDSTLFGHLKGAFTGAHSDKKGLIENAHHGVLFLDEIGELPLDTQKNLLRVLQEQRFRPVGALEEKTSDFRLLSATHRNLAAMVEQKTFRQDLLYRVMGQEILLPPLRERLEDLNHLTAFFLQQICTRYGMTTKGCSPDFLPALRAYDWPGNIRELAHCLENTVTAAGEEPILYPQHLPSYIRVRIRSSRLESQDRAQAETVARTHPDLNRTLKEARDEGAQTAEKIYLQNLLATGEKNVQALCRQAGISKPHFYALVRKHDLQLPRK